ncbi:Putative sensor [Halorientalis persicus]|uniref:Putative sensor n=1 Tax=Halorientalis persicus TaxID=1367881 RepID=A0A1H8USF2_9EURY|nr:sensor domain-containing protein [Halorientalis persicus]SEP05518.1 Putative sensor [Halorientalis persicus]
MTPDVRSHTPFLSLRSVRSALTAPLRLQTYKNFAYLWFAFPLGIVYFTALVTAFSLSIGLLVLVVGIPLVLVSFLTALALGRFERALTGWLLDVTLPEPSYEYLFGGSPIDRARELVTDRTTWTTPAYLLSKFFFGCFVFVVIGISSSIAGSFLATPLYYDEPGVFVGVRLTEPIRLTPSLTVPWDELAVGVETALRLTSWQIETLSGALAVSVAGLLVAVLVLNLSNGIARLWARYTRYMLGARSTTDSATR